MEPLTKQQTWLEVVVLTHAARSVLEPSFLARYDYVLKQFDMLQEELEQLAPPSNS